MKVTVLSSSIVNVMSNLSFTTNIEFFHRSESPTSIFFNHAQSLSNNSAPLEFENRSPSVIRPSIGFYRLYIYTLVGTEL
jgi:hypothetical protein